MARSRFALPGCLIAASLATTVLAGFGPPPRPPTIGSPLAGLRPAEIARFNAGLDAFSAAEEPDEGLGPVFTESSCVACHEAGATGGAGLRVVSRIGRLVGGRYDPMVEFGGPLIQDQGIGSFNGVNFVGEIVPPQATIVAKRRTIPLFGLGLVDGVPDETLFAIARDQAMRRPRTAGRVGMVTDPLTRQSRPGRFGWKAQQPSLLAFAGDAYANEMGITTPLFPDESCPQGDCSLLVSNPAASNPNDAENSTLQELADFMGLLAPPPPGRFARDEQAGQNLFGRIGCADCHLQALRTGPNPVRALDRVVFAPYSDFLLHDMGSLGDGIVQNQAGPNEMRTAPLWGLRFQPSLLHDGRAKTADEAIRAHDGQGRPARNNYANLSPRERAQLLAFLNAL